MKTFKQYIEALSSHGGFPFAARTGSGDAWTYGGSQMSKDPNKEQKDLINLYRNSVSKMEERLLKLPKHNFHIYYGAPNDELLGSLSTNGWDRDVSTRSQQKKALNKLFFGDMKIPRKDIVFLKAMHSGDPLTAWMTFHTLAHGLVSNLHSGGEERAIYMMGMELLKNLVRASIKNGSGTINKYLSNDVNSDVGLEDVGDTYDIFLQTNRSLHPDMQKFDTKGSKEGNRFVNILNDRDKIDEVFGCIFPFRSARAPRNDDDKFARLNASSEITYELMASYLWNGGNIPRPKRACLEKIAAFFGLTEEDTFNIIDRKFHEVESRMEKLLDAAAGKVIVD